jgi:flavin reductase (DIM6/NTAB) family NADH-FMN oxidoreductase RutF
VTVITTRAGGQTHAMTANAFVSVSLEPPLVLVSIDRRARMDGLLADSRRYGVSVLAEDQEALSDYFAGRRAEAVPITFVDWNGWPVLQGAVARLVAEVVESHPAGDHTLHVGRVTAIDWQEGKPLLFYAGRYRKLAEATRPPSTRPEDEFSLFSIGSFDLQLPQGGDHE